jgi:hypothetical protein
MLSINVGGQWVPSRIPYQGDYSFTTSLLNGNVNSPVKPSAATIGTINNATSKQLIVPWSAPTSSGIPAQTGADAPYSGVALTSGLNYVGKNNTTGELFDTGTSATLTDGSLASNTAYSYTIYSGNSAYSLSTSNYTNGAASAAKTGTTKVDATRQTLTWKCAWSESYGTDNTKKNSSSIYHGYVSSIWGNHRGLFGFNIGNTAIPANATIHSVKLYLFADWWYNHSAVATAEPTSPTGSAVASTTLSYGGENGQWNTLPVDFGNDLRANGNRVFMVQGPDNSYDHYGWFYGNGSAYEPQLQIDFTKYS